MFLRTSGRHASPKRPSLPMVQRLVVPLLAAAGFLLPCGVRAQDTGRITGLVTDAATGAALGEVQVYVPGTGLGALTRPDGRFLILNVPPGERTVRAERIGMQMQTRTVTVAAGGIAEVDFELQNEALGLDEIVVTGTAGQARRREVGTSVTQVDMAKVDKAVPSVDQVLAAKSPGMISMRSSGMSGSGSEIRLRGNVSVAMSNQPLIYVDGVRIRSDGFALNYAIGQHVAFGPKDVIGPLNDINPNDIERIEIVKGPAATALYGTEAAGGVIQIFTKKGSSGAAVWTMQVDQGSNWVQKFGPAGTDAPYMRMKPWLATSPTSGRHQQRYALSVRGGGQDLQYYVSSSYDDNAGVLPDDSETKWLIRGNTSFQPRSDLTLQWNTSITKQHITNTPSGSSPYSLAHNVYHTAPGRPSNYVGSAEFDVLNRLLEYDIETNVNRIVTGLTATYTPVAGVSNRLTLGMDRISSDMLNIRPFGYVNDPKGEVSNQEWTAESLTADYVGTFDWPVSEAFHASLSWGGQAVVNQENDLGATGAGLPGPGEHTVNSGSTILALETRLRTINAGFFGQTLFGLDDRYFLTLALRVDGNSAFGSGFGLQPYPRATFSWVASDESFWPEGLGEMKVRFAYGHAGRAPGAFDAVRTWTPKIWLGKTSLNPNNVGNPDLGPERTVEIETGFDASFLQERLNLGFTYYHQETRDALIPVEQVPTLGFSGSQLENVGVLGNSGIEASVNATLFQSRALTWDVGVSAYTNHSVVKDLGGASAFSASGGGWIQVGQPVPAVRYDKLLNPNEIAEPNVERNHIYGPNAPTHTFNLSTSFTFGNGIQISSRGEYQGGAYIFDRVLSESANRGSVAPECDNIFPVTDATRSTLTAFQRYLCTDDYSVRLVYPADFFRLRELSIQTPLPFQIPGATSASFTASAQNFLTWKNKDFLAMDPEMAGNTGMESGVTREIWEHPPPPASFRVSLRITF